MACFTRISRTTGAAAVLVLLAACGNRDSSDDRSFVDKLTSSSFTAPNEFSVLPQKPLTLPDDLANLPEPTPGARNLVDLTPNEDAIRALSGQEGKAGAVASDRALLAATGTGQAGIREVLAAEDEEYRAGNKGLLLDRLLNLVSDGEIYTGMVLDAEAELLRFRARGVWVPQLPPEE